MSLRRPTLAFLLSPLCGVAKMPDCGISFKPFMWCRLDARLRHAFYLFTFRGVAPDTRSVFIYLFTYQVVHKYYYCCMSIIFILDASMHSLIISFVRTILRVLSKYSPGLLIWPDVDEGDLLDEEFDSESDA